MQNQWRPSANLELLSLRAWLLENIRSFFSSRGVLEVETPLLGRHAVSDPHLRSFQVGCDCRCKKNDEENIFPGFLQTSPEYFMKRLLAAEASSIFQICKAFRDEEIGRYHNPEFTLLEWYRRGYDHQQLMLELRELISNIFAAKTIQLEWSAFSYQELFEKYLGINPHRIATEDLLERCITHMGAEQVQALTRDECLDLLLSHDIEPRLKDQGAVFVFDYPESQAALARLSKNPNGFIVASRFELYINGLEIANGYHELSDYEEQKKRFAEDNNRRKALGIKEVPVDTNFLAALKAGLADCAGVAVGLDRLLMVLSGAKTLAEVQAFAFSHL